MTGGWADGPLLTFDLETTGVEPATARIVTATAVLISPGGHTATTDWLADPGVEIPAESTVVHGVSTEHARQHGRPAREVVDELRCVIEDAWAAGIPVIAFNAAYDLTVLACECQRVGLATFTCRGPVIDPLVLDRHVDRYRKGKRTLSLACEHYGVHLGDDAHTSAADALAAARVAWHIARRYPEIGDADPADLHTLQQAAHMSWAENFEAWLRNAKRRDGEDEAAVAAVVIEREWPLREVTV